MAHAPGDGDDPTASLGKLAAELTSRGYKATLLTPAGRPLSLVVTNPYVGRLSETVMAHAGWYRWPWADRITPVTDVASAADRVAWVLHADGA
jgi:hypothetical protein